MAVAARAIAGLRRRAEVLTSLASRDSPAPSRDGVLVGIVSQRDVLLVQLKETLAQVPRDSISVGDAMIAEPFAVPPGTPLDVVVWPRTPFPLLALVLGGGDPSAR
jgi:CBS domain-containing protein